MAGPWLPSRACALALALCTPLAACASGTSSRPDQDGGTGDASSPRDGSSAVNAGSGRADAASPMADGALPGDSALPPAAAPDPLALHVTSATSTSVTVAWTPVPGAAASRVQLGPEPADTRDGPLPVSIDVATPAGDATRQRIEGLAPAVDVFVRVEVTGPDGAVLASEAHGRTLGGPRASLDDAVREVHALAPDVLEVVLSNGDGGQWEAGPWTVHREDGSPIAVTAVHRQSIPVGAPGYDVGFGADTHDNVIDVDHRIFLSLAEPIGARDVLSVGGPAGVHFTLPFSDRYLETPVVQVNQVGYDPHATARFAYVSGWLGDGGRLSLAGFPATADVLVEPGSDIGPRTAVVTGLPITERSMNDAQSGTEVRQIDLATVPADEHARYRVRVPGVGVSFPTAVSERAVFKEYYTVMRGLFHNRWHGDLRASCTDWSRPPDHDTVYTADGTNVDAFYPSSQPRTGGRTLHGGYHDAGDFDQRPMHTVVAELLMRAFELNHDAFTDNQLTIPESGNGIPDLLDEALWGVAAWEALSDPNGAVRMGVESSAHPDGIYFANQDPLVYWTYAENANVTARAAALFAQASRLVAPYDAARAATLREHALAAWTWATANGAKAAYRLYAAGELLRLTGDVTYATDFQSAWSELGGSRAYGQIALEHLYFGDYIGDTGSGQARAMSDYLLGYLGSASAPASFITDVRSHYDGFASDVLGHIETSHAHRNPRPAGHPYGWGQAAGTPRYMDPVIARMQMGALDAATRQRYVDALSLAADYVFGDNPQGEVYVTGLGSRSPEEPLHLDSLVFITEGRGPIPGIPVYGPTETIREPWNTVAADAFYPSFDTLLEARKYGDVRLFVKTNEFSVWEMQAPLAEMLALLIAPGDMPPNSWLPGHADSRSPLP